MASNYRLHGCGIFDETHRVVKVRGDSMAPELEHGWKVLVDVKKRQPVNGDLVAIYVQDAEDEGGVIGYWEKNGKAIRLLKENESFLPVSLAGRKLMILGTVQKVVDAPLRRKKPGRSK